MDEHKILIVTDKGDQTKDIAEWAANGEKVKITFKNSGKVYNYFTENIIVRENPIHMQTNDQVVLDEGFPLFNVEKVLVFDEKTKVFFKNQETKLYKTTSISLSTNIGTYNQIEKLLNYWKDIAQYTNSEDEQEAFLKKQFSKLNAIDKQSILATYMSQSQITQIAPSITPIIFPFRFNLSQKQALEQALTNKVSIIEGPPGTGKTQTILNILANLAIMQNKSVAVVSSNNAAVRNIKEKLEKYGYGFIVASLGNAKNIESFFKDLPEYDIADWKSDKADEATRVINDLTQRLQGLMDLANRKAQLEQKIAAYRLEQKHYQLHTDKQDYDGMQRLFYRRQTPETIIAFLADEYFLGTHSLRLVQKAKLLFKYGFFDFNKLKKKRLEMITCLQMKFYETKLNQLEQEKNNIQLELARESFEDLLQMHEGNSAVLFKDKLHQRYRNKQRFSGNEKNFKSKFDDFLDHFPIMLSTTHSLRTCIPENFLFDYVIIDEASQVDLLTGVLAMSCCKNIIVVGDTKQLPQIVNEKIVNKLKDDQVDNVYNYFKHNLLSSLLTMYGEHMPRVILKEHYRCHPKIIGFCNEQYYDNQLISFTSEADSDIPIRIFYTAKGNHYRRVTIKGKEGSLNHREIDVAKEEIIRELRLNHVPNEDIGFTTPYRLQVMEAASKLEDSIEIDTVHKYQGREKPIMIMSTVLDQTRNGQIGKKFVENSCLVNVAVSRAQKQFILVTDHALFRNSRKDIGNLIRYIEYNSMHEHITQSELISVFDLLYSEYSERLNYLQNRLVVKSKYKSENIMWRVLTDIVSEEKYSYVNFSTQVYLKDLFKNTERMSDAEKKYIKNRASFDFVIYDALNKQPLLAIEVDGFASHRNNPDQTKRDKLKNNICKSYPFPLLRLPTTGYDEISKIRNKLDEIMFGKIDNLNSN